ncbi:hypothetical protein PanWU01x14_113200 [Parasponia andersonii]|uniref:Uncharacterized protein n=1 Tax=Parasponia andersonii TaxID=3476 RepID=A0A2P5CXS9_PARAD|nr:hypothetical protein PanWU01x14_113200 [Parasponia andersonii]
MNVLDSECSSGCESGWTLYLEQSSHSPNRGSGFLDKSGNFCYKLKDKAGIEQVEELDEDEAEGGEEDLSMVSDASSGPPHYSHQDNEQVDYLNNQVRHKPCFCINDTNNKYQVDVKLVAKTSSSGKRVHKIKGGRLRECRTGDTFLDDTASSPLFNFSNMEDFTPTNNQTGSMESVLDYSQGFSATHFEGRPAFQDSCGFL